MDKKELKAKTIAFFTVLATGLFTIFYYCIINYLLFGDLGFVQCGRIVFASKFGYFDYLILPLGLFIGMKIYRNRLSNEITFRRLFKFGFITSIFAAVCFSAFIFICLQFIELDYFHKLTDLIEQLGVTTRKLTSLEKDMLTSAKSIKKIELLRNPLFYAIANFLVYIFIGILSSLLLAAFFIADRKLAFIKVPKAITPSLGDKLTL